jgi:hypothetical protein
VVEAAAPRVVVVDGETVRRRKGLSHPEVASRIRYEAARARTARSTGARRLRPLGSSSSRGHALVRCERGPRRRGWTDVPDWTGIATRG